jgi:NADPH:quinone reductase-like Zn-dependent oxidoreductase
VRVLCTLARPATVGVSAGRNTGEETFGEDLGFLAGLVSDGRLRVEASVSWDWSRTVEAVEALRQRRVTGKVVLTVG